MKLVDGPRARVVLYYPKLWEPQWPMWAPLDMYAIATSLLHRGYEVTLIDERVHPDPIEWLMKELPGALMVGLSGKFGDQCRYMRDRARLIKSVRPDLPIMAGGWFPSLFPEATLESPDIDIVAIGPGDFSAPEVADRLLAHRSLDGVQGVWARERGTLIKNPIGHLPRLDDTHPIDWELMGIRHYVHPNGWVNYFTSRGCPGGCTFCSIFCLDPHRWTALSAERVVDEMEILVHRIGAHALKIMDTDYCADVRRVERISQLILQRGLEVRYEVLGRHYNLCRMNDEQIRLLRRSGCTEIEMGVESGSQRLADLIDKQLRVDLVLGTARRFVQNGIRLKVNFMFGMPTETRADLAQSFRLMIALNDELGEGIRLQLFRFTPLPDAPLNKQVWSMKARGHDGRTPRTFDELLALPINEEPAHMFWVSKQHERDVKRTFYYYAPLVFYNGALQTGRDRPLWTMVLKVLQRIARWRVSNGHYQFPLDMWLNDWFGKPMPRADDDGIGPPEDVLPAPAPIFMGDSVDTKAPLEPVV
ncbi:MAG: radical SAM protein [Planctomycetota bacterium]